MFFLILSILCCSCSGHDPQEDSSKFGYKLIYIMKGKVLRHGFSATCLNHGEKFHKVSEILVEVWRLRIPTTHDISTFNFEDIFLATNALVLC